MMNGIEKITSQIITDAENYAKSVMSSCEEQSAQAQRSEQKRADLICEEEDKKCKLECAGVAERALSSAKVIERNILLDAKNAKIDGIFKLAEASLARLDADTRFVFLEENLKKAVMSLGDTEIDGVESSDVDCYTLFLNEKDRAMLGEKLLRNTENLVSGCDRRINISNKNAEISGGFILSRSGRELDCSFDTLLRGLSQSMRGKINTVLFG